ncbi:hypothetical protein C0Q70_00065 [Pomacea canaliculata]|uniref:Uncharacterized protein n=1 Tax=Pomacea canaliculata TaxID=400727 RepID=A0A2T7PVL7_POMCA|nr:hypothetical protein C0Q70_00065 [Pomacea canaliculata]
MVDKAARASQLSELSTAERVTSSPTAVVCPPRSCLPRMLAVPASRVDPGSVSQRHESLLSLITFLIFLIGAGGLAAPAIVSCSPHPLPNPLPAKRSREVEQWSKRSGYSGC